MYKFYPKQSGQPPLRGRLKKTLLIMKITTLILLAALLNVSAATLAQKVTLNEKNSALTDVFNHIRQQTGYDFLFSGSDIKDAKTVTITAKNEELKDVLNKIFDGQPIDFSIENNAVVIKAKEPSLLDKTKALLAQMTVQGKVTDETGDPLAGVTVRIKGTQQATTSDKNGIFAIIVPEEKTIVAFSFIGYETQEFQAKDIPNGSTVKLKASNTNLKEVVVSKGYYTIKQELNTGNVTRISGEDIAKSPVSDPILALQGRVAGLSIQQGSGIPGSNMVIRLRGQNSIANGNDPLYIIDGVPFTSNSLTNTNIGGGAVGNPATSTPLGTSFSPAAGGLSPFNNLNPANIESIEILKDADATAIYGSRGANGVILITTKSGKPGDTKIDVDFSQGVGQITRSIEMLNTEQYLQMRREAYSNDGALMNSSTNYDVNGSWDTTRFTNWQKLFIGNKAQYTNAQLSLSGGNANTQFLIGGGYNMQTNVFPGEYSDVRASSHLKLTHASTNQKLHATATVDYTSDLNKIPQVDFTSTILLPPDAPALYDGNGNPNFQNGTFQNNPAAGLFRNAQAKTMTLISNLNFSYQLLKNLQFVTRVGYTNMELNQSNQSKAVASNVLPSGYPNARTNQFATTNLQTLIIEPQFNYKKIISKGELNILVGTTYQKDIKNSIAQKATGFSSDALISNITAASSITVYTPAQAYEYRYAALFGRVSYNWEEKYLLNVTARRDGSSRFGSGNQFGNFGSIGAGWIFSKEKFTDNVPFLSFGKLRMSYGVTGNDQIGDYQYLSTYSAFTTTTYQGVTTLSPNRIANPYFGWEVNKKFEAGLELGLFKDQVFLTASYYRNRSSNQLVGQPLPFVAGFNTVQANLPATVQNTGVELALNTTNIQNKNFTWTTGINFTIPKNKLIDFPGLANNSNYNSLYEVGKSLYIQRRYHFTGINSQTGLYTFEDVNHDGILDNNDLQFLKPIAQTFYGGIQNSFRYSQWQLDFLISFVKQTSNNLFQSSSEPGTLGNQPSIVLNRWTKPGDQPVVQKYGTDSGIPALAGYVFYQGSDGLITDGSYIRLKNVALSYNLPQKWQKAAHLHDVKIFAQAQNLFTLTNYLGLDPETGGLNLPPLRMITIGAHIGI